MPRSRRSAAAMVRGFEAAHERMLFAGAGDPDDVEYWREQHRIARERLIRYLMDDTLAGNRRKLK